MYFSICFLTHIHFTTEVQVLPLDKTDLIGRADYKFMVLVIYCASCPCITYRTESDFMVNLPVIHTFATGVADLENTFIIIQVHSDHQLI